MTSYSTTVAVPDTPQTFRYFRNATQLVQAVSVLQAHFIEESFKAQIADHCHLYQVAMKRELQVLSRAVIAKLFAAMMANQSNSHRPSLDTTISNVREAAKIPQSLYIIIGDYLNIPSQYRASFLKAYQRFLSLDKQVAFINTFSLKDLNGKKKELISLFFDALYPCEYDRSLITPGSPLEFVLDSRIGKAHDQPDRVDPITGRKVRKTLLEAHFARRLGVKLEQANSHWHLVYYLLDRSKKRLGVFKPVSEIGPLADRYGASEEREGHLAEAASFSTDKFLGTKVVPHTQLVKCHLSSSADSAPVIGSFQFYVDNALDLFSQLEGENLFSSNFSNLTLRLNTSANRELEFRNLEQFAFFDLLTGNNDHHFKNIMLKRVAPKTWDLIAIDNANSFPWCHDLDLPSYKTHPFHWFKWSTLPQAQRPFSNSMINRIKALDLDNLEKILKDKLVSRDVPSSKELFQRKMNTLHDRFHTIELLASQKVSLSAIAMNVLTLTHSNQTGLERSKDLLDHKFEK